MLIPTRILSSLIFLLISSCASSSPTEKLLTPQKDLSMKESTVESKVQKNHSWQKVTVKYIDLEGGFYGLISEKGAKLLPVNLPVDYKVDGTILQIQGEVLTGMMTIQQWGKVFKITEHELIKQGEGKQPEF